MENAPWLYHYSKALECLENKTNVDTTKAQEKLDSESNDTGEEAQNNGSGCSSWRRPSSENDRLYMSVGNSDVIEVGHPSSKNENDDPR